jgi:hypothetical protein
VVRIRAVCEVVCSVGVALVCVRGVRGDVRVVWLRGWCVCVCVWCGVGDHIITKHRTTHAAIFAHTPIIMSVWNESENQHTEFDRCYTARIFFAKERNTHR